MSQNICVFPFNFFEHFSLWTVSICRHPVSYFKNNLKENAFTKMFLDVDFPSIILKPKYANLGQFSYFFLGNFFRHFFPTVASLMYIHFSFKDRCPSSLLFPRNCIQSSIFTSLPRTVVLLSFSSLATVSSLPSSLLFQGQFSFFPSLLSLLWPAFHLHFSSKDGFPSSLLFPRYCVQSSSIFTSLQRTVFLLHFSTLATVSSFPSSLLFQRRFSFFPSLPSLLCLVFHLHFSSKDSFPSSLLYSRYCVQFSIFTSLPGTVFHLHFSTLATVSSLPSSLLFQGQFSIITSRLLLLCLVFHLHFSSKDGFPTFVLFLRYYVQPSIFSSLPRKVFLLRFSSSFLWPSSIFTYLLRRVFFLPSLLSLTVACLLSFYPFLFQRQVSFFPSLSSLLWPDSIFTSLPKTIFLSSFPYQDSVLILFTNRSNFPLIIFLPFSTRLKEVFFKCAICMYSTVCS